MNNAASLPLCILEEIGLDGLEGITLEGLWKRLSVRLRLPLPFNQRITSDVWQFVQKAKCLQFFKLPEERDPLILFDRADFTDPLFGNTEPEVCPYTIYNYNPISTQEVRGSCEHFDTRIEIPKDDVADYTVDEIESKYGRRFIILASQCLRNALLIPPTASRDIDLNISHYCILERLGRARHNGELTHGKYSLADVGGDPILLHHHKKKLHRHNLVQCQPFYQVVDGTNIAGQLLHLPRFFALFKPRQVILMEKIMCILKAKPNCMAEYQEVKGHFEENLQRTLARLFKSPFFHKFVLTDTRVPYRAIYPYATEKEWKLPKKDTERTLNVLQLRDANIDPSQLWDKCENVLDEQVADDEEEGEGFLDESHAIRDLPLLYQLYTYIRDSKEAGVSELEARIHFGQSKLNGRALIRNVVKRFNIVYFTVSQKRQVIRRYILPEFSKRKRTTNEGNEPAIDTSINEVHIVDEIDAEMPPESVSIDASTDVEPHIKSEQCTNASYEDIEVIQESETDERSEQSTIDDAFRTEREEHKIRIVHDINVKITKIDDSTSKVPKTITDKTEQRMQFIEREIKAKILYDDPAKLHGAIKREEASRGLSDVMCRKTFYRLLFYMSQKKMLQLFRVEFQYRTKHRSLIYVTDMSVDADFSLMQSCIDQAKSKFQLNIFEEECRMENKRARSVATKQPEVEKPVEKEEPRQKLSTITNQSLNYGITPKFIRLRTLHEFVFYLAREHRSIEYTNQEEIVDRLKEASPTAFADIDEVPTIWNPEIGWQMFIPPLIKHNGFDKGWCLLSDCIYRMPLSIFVKLVNITFEIKGLEDYLSHPIKKHFLVNSIPVNLQRMLFARRKYIASLHDLLRRLICIGLVQAGPHRAMKDQAFYYMNTLATLIDTSTSLPGTYYITKQDYTELVYNFNSLEDVTTYWDDMHRICMSTKLNLKPSNTDQTPADKVFPQKLLVYLKSIQPRQAKERDMGDLPGDRRGAAGLDSYYFAHLERNWAFNPMKYKSVDIKPKRVVVAPVKYNRLVRMTRDVNLKKHEKRVAPVPLHKLKSAAIRRRVPIVRKKIVREKRKRERVKYDDIDKMALQHMNKLRVDWNQQEDNFLLLCKVAQMYLNPSNRLMLPGQIFRDLIHWHCKSLNKTSLACRRRISYITKKLPNSDQINNSIMMCLNEIKANKSMEKRLGANFVRNLHKVYPDEDEFNKAFRIHFIDLVHTLSCQYYNLTNKFESSTLILPRTLQEFNARFYERTDSVYDSNTIRYDEPQNVDDIKIAEIVTLIHSTVCCSYDKTSWSIQLYEIYKDFPERLLSIAMRKVRSDQLISQNKMNTQNVVQNRCLPLSSSAFHLSMTYQQQMTTKIAYDIFDESYSNIEEIIKDVSIRKEPHILNLSHSAICFFIAELSHKKGYNTNIEIPKRVLLLDPSKRLPDESFEGVYDRFHEIFNYIPKVDMTGADDSTLDDLISGLPFEDKNPSTNEANNIIEKLECLPSETIHFFCIIDNFGATKPRDQLKLTEDGKCPFDCLKQVEKPFENIMDKLVAKREVWYRLNTEQFEFEPLPDEVTIDETNIIAVYNYVVLSDADVTDEQRNTNVELFKKVSDIVDELFIENDKDFIDEDFGADYDLRDDVKKKLYDGAQINDKIHKFHDFLCVNTCKLSLVPGKEVDTDESIDLRKLKKKRDDILAEIVQDANWSPEFRPNEDFVSLMKGKNLDMNDIHIAIDVYNFIDQQGEMGAKAITLVERYEDKEFLQKILDYLNHDKLVMKTGVCEITYVHWKHIKSWVVNTYNLKRYDRESVAPSTKNRLQVGEFDDASSVATDSGPAKRKSEDDSNEIPAKIKRTKHDESPAKENTTATESVVDLPQDAQIEETEAGCSSNVTQTKSSAKPLNIPLPESIIEHGEEMDPDHLPQIKKTFPLKMAPWIRVNGSVNRRVLDKYAGTILLHCIENVGLTLFTLCTRFHYLLPIHVHEIVQYLEKFGCLKKTAISKPKPVTLFSKYESVTIGAATDLDDFRHIVIEPSIDAVTKMSIFIGDKKYKKDFI